MRKTRTAGAVLLALAVAGSVAACAADDDGAATLAELQASAGPSLSAEEKEKQKVIDEAETFLAEFRQAEADAGNDGFTAWPTLANEYWGTELAQGLVPAYQEMAKKGQYTTGAQKLVSSEVTDYVASEPGHEQVEITSCLDTSPLHLHEKDGSEIPLPNGATPGRGLVVQRVEHQGEGNSWRVTESTPQDGSC